jgi:hypothetical protein
MDQKPPKNYLVESILVTIFCCLPFGIAGIVFASQVNTKFASGDYEGALASSKNAKKWMTWGLILSILYYVVIYFFIFSILGIAVLGFGNN